MFAGLGAVTIRRLFGGKGVYHGGLIVAALVRGEMRLKGDEVTAPALEAAGATRWVYKGRAGQPVAMPYWTVPDAAWDDPDAMTGWVRLAYEAAQRTAQLKAAGARRAARG